MKITQKRVKELIESMTNERKELFPKYENAVTHHLDFIEEEDILVIAEYNFLGGQLYAYEKILQIMQLKVK